MTNRRFHARRRLRAWLAALLIGVAGALTVTTPATAATTCTLTLTVNWWPTIDGQARWMVVATIANTGPASSNGWWTIIEFPAGAAVPLYWNVRRSPFSYSTYLAAPYNGVIPSGGSTNFGFEVRTPSSNLVPTPTTSQCVINY